MVSNGRLPSSSLASTQIGGRLRKDAAASADRLALAFYLHFGKPLVVSGPLSTYRSYAEQVATKKKYGSFAAAPGTSNHGLGKAVDFGSGIADDNSAAHRWMEQNAGAYGWENPLWARNANRNDGEYEPWHWEYNPAKDRRKNADYIRKPGLGWTGLGHSGAKVREIQTLHNQRVMDKDHIKVDGKFGYGTAVAIYKFQKARGLKPTGTVGITTMNRLKNKPAKINTRPWIFLRKDTNKHADTERLQTFLNTLPGVSIKVDGFYGERTEAAVKKFQRLVGLVPETGNVNAKTKRALEARGVTWK